MSAPLVGGIVACWLQARPDLTPEDILELFGKTCTQRDDYSYPNTEYGYGEIDAYKGLLHLLGLSGIQDISTSQPKKADIRVHNRQITINFQSPSQKVVHALVYNLRGECLTQITIPQGTTTINIPMNFTDGVYVVQLNSGNPSLCGSTLIRL